METKVSELVPPFYSSHVLSDCHIFQNFSFIAFNLNFSYHPIGNKYQSQVFFIPLPVLLAPEIPLNEVVPV